jgi:hypothetical protein
MRKSSPKEGDICTLCQKGILEYVRNDQNKVELKCNNPKCSNSHNSLRPRTVGNGSESVTADHRDDNAQTMLRSRFGQR